MFQRSELDRVALQMLFADAMERAIEAALKDSDSEADLSTVFVVTREGQALSVVLVINLVHLVLQPALFPFLKAVVN